MVAMMVAVARLTLLKIFCVLFIRRNTYSCCTNGEGCKVTSERIQHLSLLLDYEPFVLTDLIESISLGESALRINIVSNSLEV
jgi:hypothetical protein